MMPVTSSGRWERKGNFEIGRILHLRSEIRNSRLDWPAETFHQAVVEGFSPRSFSQAVILTNRTRARALDYGLVQSEISDFGSEMQDSSNLKISLSLPRS